VAFAQKEIDRIRNEIERSFLETKEIFIHMLLPPLVPPFSSSMI